MMQSWNYLVRGYFMVRGLQFWDPSAAMMLEQKLSVTMTPKLILARSNHLWILQLQADRAIVLGLAEMELIFPIAALIMLCSVLVARKVLITHQCFGYC